MGAGFFERIAIDHGPNTTELLKQFAKTNCKLSSFTARKFFLLKCRKNNIFPKHIINNIKCAFQSIEENSPFTQKIDNLILDFKRKLLNIEIRITFWRIGILRKEINDLRTRIDSLDIPSLDVFFSSQEKHFDKQFNDNVSGLNAKFDSLSFDQLKNNIQSDTESFIHNATTEQIPADVKFITGLGPRFGLPYENNKIPVFSLIADLETVITNCVDTPERNNIRYNVVNVLNKAISNRNSSAFDNFLIKKRKIASEYFKDHSDILCMRSDKGGKTVFMNRIEYENKASEMLNDVTTYQPIRDPTNRLQRITNSFVKKLFETQKIDVRTKYSLSANNTSPPLMYFLAKHHKRDMPLRPICADLNGPMRGLSEFASNILSKLKKSDYHLRNSYDFQNFIASCTYENDEEMVSFDVVSLFTNAPVKMIIEIIEMRWNEIEQHTNLSKIEFLELITLCTDNCYFAYREKFYRQCYGTPMGAPISPILVELLMDFILDKIQELMETRSGKLRIIKKYVDDLFLLIPKGKVNEILEIFNSVDDRIQFTFEMENNNCIPFLDMTVHRDEVNRKYITNWYRKPMASGRMLNYHSIHPMNQKLSAALGLIDRVHRLSDDRFQTENDSLIRDILLRNDYPIRLINRLMNRYYHRNNSTTTNTITLGTDATAIKCFSLPYVPYVSRLIAKSITNACDNVRVAFRNTNNVSCLYSKLKDKIPLEEATNVVYRINCVDCNNNECYIGTTGQKLHKRKKQHMDDVAKKQQNRTALAHHAVTKGHNFDFDNLRILERESNYHKRMFLEELHIKSCRNCVNLKSIESKNISEIYTPLLEKLNN